MKRKGLIAVLVLLVMTITVIVCEDASGMEHTDDHSTKYSFEFIKAKNKKRYLYSNKG